MLARVNANSQRQISAFHLPGDIFAIETTDTYRFSAGAVIDTTVRIAKARTLFEGHSGGDASAIKNVLNLVTRNLQHPDHMLLLGRKISLEKVAAFLLKMDCRSEAAGAMIFPMSRRDIADRLGLTLETSTICSAPAGYYFLCRAKAATDCTAKSL